MRVRCFKVLQVIRLCLYQIYCLPILFNIVLMCLTHSDSKCGMDSVSWYILYVSFCCLPVVFQYPNILLLIVLSIGHLPSPFSEVTYTV